MAHAWAAIVMHSCDVQWSDIANRRARQHQNDPTNPRRPRAVWMRRRARGCCSCITCVLPEEDGPWGGRQDDVKGGLVMPGCDFCNSLYKKR